MGSQKDSLSAAGRRPEEFVRAPNLVTINAKPEPIEVDLSRTALIVIDMQNGALNKGGMFDLLNWHIPKTEEIIDNNIKIVEAARRGGCKVIFIKMSFEADYSNCGGPESPTWHKEAGLRMMRAHPEDWGRFLTEGSWDEELIDELKPEPGDIVIRKQRYSAFCGTRLDLTLKTYNIKYCIYSGVATNVCVESTLRDGFHLDYWPIIVSDAVGSAGPPATQEATLWNIEALFGWVTETEDVLKALS